MENLDGKSMSGVGIWRVHLILIYGPIENLCLFKQTQMYNFKLRGLSFILAPPSPLKETPSQNLPFERFQRTLKVWQLWERRIEESM